MSLIDIDDTERATHPVDLVEQIANSNDWSFERSGEDEITISTSGRWADYHASFSWMDPFEALHMAVALDIKVPEMRRAEVTKLLALVNERQWMGHFDLWAEEGVVMFRHVLLFSGGLVPGEAQIEALVAHAVEACEQNYQAFQFVIWAGKTAREAMEASLFETVGEA